MNILLTSGGTKVPIDRVRSITNMSRGTFGAKIARQLLFYDDVHLTYLGAKEFRMPFSVRFDFAEGNSIGYTAIQDALNRSSAESRSRLYNICEDRYTQITYKTFSEYAENLESLVKKMRKKYMEYVDSMGRLKLPVERKDVVILAAAASDYIVPNPNPGKIRSDDELSVELEVAPKLIKKIKEWHPDCHLIGFKLLVDSTDKELIEAAEKSLYSNGCDFVIANDLRDIKVGKHRLLIVSKREAWQEYHNVGGPEYLANIVAEKIHSL